MAGKKIALVTGATRGIVFETVRQLAQAGMHVLLAARNPASGEAKAAALRHSGLSVEAIELDLNNLSTADAAAATIAERFGHLDVLVNNAGILLLDTDGFPGVADPQAIRDTIEVNFVATVVVTQKMLPLLRKATAGRIVNVSSTVGSLWWNGDPDNPVPDNKWLGYAASKAALNMMTVELAFELRNTSVKVNSICPGYVKTDINRGGGICSIEEGARASVHYALIGEDGPNGQFLNVNGPIPW